MSASDSVDPVQFARLGRKLSGELAAERLPRLSDQVVRLDGPVRYEISGHVRPDGKPAIHLHVETRVCVVCHRCTGGLMVPVMSTRELVFVDADQMPAIEDEDEQTDHMPAGEKIDPTALVEEELMLSLPMVPRHEQCLRSGVSDDEFH